MKNRAQLCLRQAVLILAGFLLAGVECAPAGDLAKIDKAAVRNIEVLIDEDNLDQFGVALNTSAIGAQVAKNLAAADFPVQKTSAKTFSHTLNAHLSRIKHQGTPTGFSFSIGNSDPRAEDFQKADVLTIECALTAKQDPRATAQHTMEFSANRLKTLRDKNRIAETLSDQISAACFNLLEELDLDATAPPATGGSIKRPRWMPDIRIEIKNEPTPATKNTGASAGKPENTEAPHKEMIIHNQGTPVILKFGHERM